MKSYRILAGIMAVAAVSFALVGFECSSAELTSAKLYMQRSEWDKAEEQLLKEVSANPQDEQAWYYLGRVRGEKQNWTGMREAFQHALSISDEDKKDIVSVEQHYWVQYYNEGTKLLQRAKDSSSYFDKAIAGFRNAITIEPDSMLAYKGLAYTYLNMMQEDSAIEPLTLLWNKYGDEDAAKFLSEIYYQNGQKLKDDFQNDNEGKLDTLKNVKSIAEGMSEEEISATLGQPDQKTSTDKRKNKKKTIEASGQEVWVYKTYGFTLSFDQDRLKTKKVDFEYNPQVDSSKYMLALVQFKKALDVLVPATKKFEEDRDLMTVLTNCYIAADMSERATEVFKAGALKNPGNADFQYNYGVLLLRADDFENAIDQFKKAIDAANATVSSLQGKLAHPDSSVNQDKANEDLSRTQATIWNSTYNLGASYVNWGVKIQTNASTSSDPDSLHKAVSTKFELALPYLEKYSTYKQDDPNLWELLAKVYAFMNNVQKASDAIKKADALRQIH